MGGIAFTWSMVSLVNATKGSLLTTCPSPGEDIFVDEECVAQV